MNDNISRLHNIASKKVRTILGLMSGTSFDGLDIAFCRITGSGMNTRIVVEAFETVAYEDDFRSKLKKVFANPNGRLEDVCHLNAYIGREHARLVNEFLGSYGYKSQDVDLLASHGQTVFHAPSSSHDHPGYGNSTLQLGDGDHIAVNTSIITISDFRQKHIAAGGEGAPLAAYGDYFIFSQKGENRLLLNIGGIANFTFLPADGDLDRVFSTDIGPGNTMMDSLVQQRMPTQTFDRDGELASKGNINRPLLKVLLDHPFFELPFPKTTGPELFSAEYLKKACEVSGCLNLSLEDSLATLNIFTATVIANAIREVMNGKSNSRIFASGGGIHNKLLMQHLQDLLPEVSLANTDSLGIHPDAKEAVLFAILANECVAGAPVSLGSAKGIPAITMGKISFPF